MLRDVRLGKPLSRFLGTDEWPTSVLGRLAEKSNNSIFLTDIPRYYRNDAPYVWRVVYMVESAEDTLMTRFRAYGPDGAHLPYTTFGVHYDSLPPDRYDVKGSYEFPPVYKDQYIWAVENNFLTKERAGYIVQVMDEKYPSEMAHFGLLTEGDKQRGGRHVTLVIGFQLFENDAVK